MSPQFAILAAISPIVNQMLKDGPVEVNFQPGTGKAIRDGLDGVRLEVGPAWGVIQATPGKPNGVYSVSV